ncbi:MAG: TIGR04282 family arsenosugar biosynthesis glycosyltransferase [Polaromonas sp.]
MNDTHTSACRVVIIAKAPIPGYCKTRLIPALGTEGAAALASRMLLRTVQTALAAGVGPVEMCAAPSRHEAAWAALGLPAVLDWSEQREGDLGARMAAAAQRTLSRGERVLLIGTDCPELDEAHLRSAAASLLAHDVSLVPTADGGYALLGLSQFHPSLFDNMPWSTDTVAGETLGRLAKIPWTVKTLQMLHDIDEPADLRWLPDDLKTLTEEAMHQAI